MSRDRRSRSLRAATSRSEAPGLVRFVRPAPEVHLDLTRLAVTHDLQLDRRAGRVGADRSRELDRVANGLAVDLDDRVPPGWMPACAAGPLTTAATERRRG